MSKTKALKDKLNDIDNKIIKTEEHLKQLKVERKETKKKLEAAEEQEILAYIKELKITPEQAKELFEKLINSETRE